MALLRFIEKLSEEKIKWLKTLNGFFKKIFEYINKLFKLSIYPSIALYVIFLLLIVYLVYFIIKKLASSGEKKITGTTDKQQADYFNLDYKRELKSAEDMLNKKKLKEAFSFMLNALWLFYHYQKVIIYNRSITNREYMGLLKARAEYSILKSIVLNAEKAVYAGKHINEKDCQEIYSDVYSILSQ